RGDAHAEESVVTGQVQRYDLATAADASGAPGSGVAPTRVRRGGHDHRRLNPRGGVDPSCELNVRRRDNGRPLRPDGQPAGAAPVYGPDFNIVRAGPSEPSSRPANKVARGDKQRHRGPAV